MPYNKILTLCLLFCFFLPVTAQTPRPVEQLLQAPFMKGASFSLIVKDLESERTLYGHNVDLQVSPASVLKTVATATALEILGSDYRFPTSVEYSGRIENSVLKGNLFIKGSGDPSLGSSHFGAEANSFMQDWISAIRKAGIKKIEGSVISDESIFDSEGASAKWIREDMGNYYAPGCYGLSVFDNLYKLSFETGPAGSQPVIKGCDPEIPDIRFINYLKAAPVASDSGYIYGAPLAHERYLYGVLPAKRERYILKGDIPDPALFLAQYVTRELKKGGVDITGDPTCYRLKTETGEWKKEKRITLITTYSPTLGEITNVTNHVSHNLFADALVKTVGLQYKPGQNEVISSFDRGVRIIKAYWTKKGLDTFSLWINDGSGLAPSDKVSARFISDLLVYMATQSAEATAFVTSLPRPGLEGSVRNFLKGTKLQGKSRLKSGGITRVRSYAGYITQGNKTYAIAVFSNNYSCSMVQMTKELEQLLLKLFN